MQVAIDYLFPKSLESDILKGDFSRIKFEKNRKFSGVLHQQGRVLLDRNWNEQVDITVGWQDQVARDVIGSRVAAIPMEKYDSFRLKENTVTIEPERIGFEITPGRMWADGIPLILEQPETKRYATPLDSYVRGLDNTVHYAVVLEVWRDAISGFQMPKDLMDPALGGIDATERLQTAFAFKYFEVADANIACQDIIAVLDDYISREKIRLTVEIQEGYTGLEHRLYRIEIADLTKRQDATMFKWSRSNAGLAGRGRFDETRGRMKITENLQPILNSESKHFYLEVIEYRSGLGYWMPTFGATVRLVDSEIFEITEIYLNRTQGSNEVKDEVFFRLWDGIEPVGNYEESAHLEAGIFIEFEQTNSLIRAGNYWVFPVRTKSVEFKLPIAPLPTSANPHGIDYRLVPFAIVSRDGDVIDCRKPIPSLTKIAKCCETSSSERFRLLSTWTFITIASVLWTYSIVEITLAGLMNPGLAIIILIATLSLAGWIISKVPDLLSN